MIVTTMKNSENSGEGAMTTLLSAFRDKEKEHWTSRVLRASNFTEINLETENRIQSRGKASH